MSTSNRNGSGIHTPTQRPGSKLEVLPPEGVESVGKGADDLRTSPLPQRSSSEPNQDSGRKQVVLPTLKRDYEKHGLPKDGIPQFSSRKNEARNDAAGHSCLSVNSSFDKGKTLNDRETVNVESQIESLMTKLKVNEETKLPEDSRVFETSKENGNTENTPYEDGYYISHTPSLQPSEETLPSTSTSADSIPGKSSGVSGEESSSCSDDEEEVKAPFELMGEFLESVMDEDYEMADKLCQMILIYEPDNKECKQFQPLIEEMLKREREAQLWGSDDSDDDSDESDTDSGGDSDGSSEESSEESSSESEEEEEEVQR